MRWTVSLAPGIVSTPHLNGITGCGLRDSHWITDTQASYTAILERLPEAKPKRFSVNYHLLALRDNDPARVRVQVWIDDGEAIPSVVSVWPTADWHEREAYDLMGIVVDGHPNLTRILMDDDWEGYPLRKDYPIGGEPVRFSGEE